MQTTLSPHITIEIADPKKLSRTDYQELHEVTQDMWAYGLGEFVRCHKCEKVWSKTDIFGHMPKESLRNKVSQIMRSQGIDTIHCPCCGLKTEMMYGETFIDVLRKKLSGSVYSVLMVARKDREIVGYMDGYIDDFDTLYQTELSLHYPSLPGEFIRNKVEQVLDRKVREMMYFSEAGFIQAYSGLQNFFSLFRALFSACDRQYRLVPGITELDKNNQNLYRIYQIMGSRVLDLPRGAVNGAHDRYESVVSVFDSPIDDFFTKFDLPFREFLRKYMK